MRSLHILACEMACVRGFATTGPRLGEGWREGWRGEGLEELCHPNFFLNLARPWSDPPKLPSLGAEKKMLQSLGAR